MGSFVIILSVLTSPEDNTAELTTEMAEHWIHVL